MGSCSTVAAGGSGQGSGVQCSAHHLKVPAPEVQSFWSFIYYNPLFPPPPSIFPPYPILLKKIKFFVCFQVAFRLIFLLSSEHVGNVVVHGVPLTGSLGRDTWQKSWRTAQWPALQWPGLLQGTRRSQRSSGSQCSSPAGSEISHRLRGRLSC